MKEPKVILDLNWNIVQCVCVGRGGVGGALYNGLLNAGGNHEKLYPVCVG